MDYLEPFIDLRRPECDAELFAIALAFRSIRMLIQPGGSDRGRPDAPSALHPHHPEAFLARTLETGWKDRHVAQVPIGSASSMVRTLCASLCC